MYKLLILLTISGISLANCDYTLELKSQRSDITSKLVELRSFALDQLNNKNYNIVDESINTINLKLKSALDLNKFKTKTFLYRRSNGNLINYSYGEGKSYSSQRRSLSLDNIHLSIQRSIDQLPECTDD